MPASRATTPCTSGQSDAKVAVSRGGNIQSASSSERGASACWASQPRMNGTGLPNDPYAESTTRPSAEAGTCFRSGLAGP